MRLQAGRRLQGRYEIEDQLGAGGMGVVYRARDRRLDRLVAVKVLGEAAASPEGLARLEREAKVLAALSHPNVVTIHDFGAEEGTTFVVMELLQGATLREVLLRSVPAPERLLGIAWGVARGLGAAHALGVIHRDLKPENVFLTREGEVKLLDFGLARHEAQRHGEQQLTRPDIALGTVHYMSPEQLRGERLTPASDVFSFGSLLHEMLSGRRPFTRRSDAETIQAILKEDAPPLPRSLVGVPPGVGEVAARCLRRDPAERFAHGGEVVRALEAAGVGSASSGASELTAAIATGPRGIGRRRGLMVGLLALLLGIAVIVFLVPRRGRAIESVAVLPFQADAEAEYLGDGLAEAITDDLAQVAGLRVAARGAAFARRGADPVAVGRELGVRAVVTGRVVQAEQGVKVRVDLVDVDQSSQLWGGEYDRPSGALPALRAELAGEIAGRLRASLTGSDRDRLGRRPTQDADAFKLYLRGRHAWNKRTAEGLQRAASSFAEAIERDPAYALAHAGLADCYALESLYGGRPTRESFPKARAAAERALEIEPRLAQAHATLGFVRYRFDWDYRAAESEFGRALALDPSYATAHQWYGLMLAAQGRFDAAVAELRRAQDLDPLSAIIQTDLGLVLFYADRLDEAVAVTRTTLLGQPDFRRAHSNLMRVHEWQQRCPEAAEAALLAAGDDVGNALRAACAAQGMRGYWETRLAQAEATIAQDPGPGYLPRFERAVALAALARDPEAVTALEQARDDRSYLIVWLRVQPQLRGLASEPRYLRLLTDVGLGSPP